MHDRHPTAQVVYYDEHLFLVDCGEGTQMQMSRYKIRRNRIRHIFISHLHGDHYFGLPGLLTGYGLNGRTEDLWIFSPPLLKGIIEMQLQASDTVLPYPLHFVAVEKEGILLDEKKLTVTCFPVSHRIACWGFLFKEKEKPLKLDSKRLHQYAIPSSFYHRLKMGEDYITGNGAIIRNEWLTQLPEAVRSYAYCADTLYDESIAVKCRNSTLLYHEATYLDDQREKAMSRMHATSRQAAAIALKANAHRLILGHFSSRYENLEGFAAEAREIFPHTDLALEGATYLV